MVDIGFYFFSILFLLAIFLASFIIYNAFKKMKIKSQELDNKLDRIKKLETQIQNIQNDIIKQKHELLDDFLE